MAEIFLENLVKSCVVLGLSRKAKHHFVAKKVSFAFKESKFVVLLCRNQAMNWDKLQSKIVNCEQIITAVSEPKLNLGDCSPNQNDAT